jgi:hypothetical protein
MADEMVQEQSTPLEFPPDWPAPVIDAYNRLFAYDVDALEGGARFGDLAFTELKPLVDRIRQLAWDLTMESWQDLPDSLDDQLLANVNAVNETLEQIGAFDLNQAEPANARNNLIQSLTGQAGWFKNNVRPHTLKAHGERAALDVAGTDGAASEAAAVREELASLRSQADQVGRELAAREDLVEGLRKVAGESASDDLAAVFANRARKLGGLAKTWLIALCVSGVVALGGALITFALIRPHDTDSVSGEDIARITLAAFIVGLLVYAVKTCAQQYRANRHLEAVAESKAAALSTFTRFSSAIAEESVRSTVALVLAQAVFATEETGYVEAAADRVTLMDHVLPRISGTGGTPQP